MAHREELDKHVYVCIGTSVSTHRRGRPNQETTNFPSMQKPPIKLEINAKMTARKISRN